MEDRGERTGFDDVGHRLGLTTGAQISVCKTPCLSTGTAMPLAGAETVQERPLLSRITTLRRANKENAGNQMNYETQFLSSFIYRVCGGDKSGLKQQK